MAEKKTSVLEWKDVKAVAAAQQKTIVVIVVITTKEHSLTDKTLVMGMTEDFRIKDPSVGIVISGDTVSAACATCGASEEEVAGMYISQHCRGILRRLALKWVEKRTGNNYSDFLNGSIPLVIDLLHKCGDTKCVGKCVKMVFRTPKPRSHPKK